MNISSGQRPDASMSTAEAGVAAAAPAAAPS
jgi:hypothetical protein